MIKHSFGKNTVFRNAYPGEVNFSLNEAAQRHTSKLKALAQRSRTKKLKLGVPISACKHTSCLLIGTKSLWDHLCFERR